MMVNTMGNLDGDGDAGTRGRVAWWTGAALETMLSSVTIGYAVGYFERLARGGGSTRSLLILLGAIAILAVGAAALVRWRHVAFVPGESRGPSERANHRLLAISGAMGGVIGIVMAMAALQASPGTDDAAWAMLYGPLPVWAAVLLALAFAGVLVLSRRWERVVDEHERDAYRDGAVAGFYVIGVGAPIWWVLWRGGLLPAIDPIGLYAATVTVTGVVWLVRKYR